MLCYACLLLFALANKLKVEQEYEEKNERRKSDKFLL
jgi:hypothetical protein